jgi:hypothetical protein
MLFILISFVFNSMAPAKSATPDFEAQWKLTVTGLVENILNLGGTEIVAMPKSTVNAAIVCVDFPGEIVMQGNWTGVKLRALLEEAKPLPTAIKIAFFAADGYSTDLTMETAMRDNVILAYEKDGEPLNDLRLVVPGKWGYKWISQLIRIELVDFNFLGRWESAGYSDEADVGSSSGPSLRDLGPSFPSSSPTPLPATSPFPSPTQPPLTSPSPLGQPIPTPEPSTGIAIPSEAVYTIAASAVAIVLVAIFIVVHKKTK